MIFPCPMCHRHTFTLCMTGTGDSVDGVATCYRLDSQIWTPVKGKIFSLSPTCLDQPWGPPSRVYCGKWPTFLGVQQSGHGADHPSQSSADVRISSAIPLLLLYATNWQVMEWPLPSTYVWLIVHELSFYVSANKGKQPTIKLWNTTNLQRKFSSFRQ